MKLQKLILITFLSFTFISSYAQENQTKKQKRASRALLKKANQEYEKFAYVKTTALLLDLAKEGYKSEDLFQKLGNSYYFNNKMEEAAKWYGELMSFNEAQEDYEYFFRYAQALKVVENYKESDKWMTKFHAANEADIRGRAFASTKDYKEKIEAINNKLALHNLDINSANSDFGTAQFQRQLIFASSRVSKDSTKKDKNTKTYLWNNQPYLDLYTADKRNDSSYTNVKGYGELINTKYHESSAAFTPNERIMFFTRNNYFEEKYKEDGKGTNKLKLFRTFLQDDGEWTDLESIHFNSDDYSVAHPSVNVYGTKIYFASDMPGTTGASDIYVADLNRDGTLGEPVNLGAAVNTEGHETFPFINEKGDLFYSSNGLPGLGGLDVYVIRNFETKYENNQPLAAENLGRPINSSYDDFSYYENLGTAEGFFSSNRPGGKGDDDIYSFKAYHPTDCKQEVTGIVKNKKTGELIPFATVILFDSSGDVIDQLTVGDDAAFAFSLDCNTQYLVRGEKKTYDSDEKRITSPRTDLRINPELGLALNLDLDPLVAEAGPHKVGEIINTDLGINIIYFDFDKDNIRPDAAKELQKVILYMKTYPTVHIDVRSHTDSRGKKAYNENLSKRRNKSTIAYLIEVGGIDSYRLTGNGYGESMLVNNCADGVKCTEDEHDLNRRSEFVVSKQ